MPNINNCVPYRAGTCSSFVSSENGCKHEAKNPDKKAIRQFKVDGEVFPKGHDPERCDWLLLDDTKGSKILQSYRGITIMNHHVDLTNPEDVFMIVSVNNYLPDEKKYKSCWGWSENYES